MASTQGGAAAEQDCTVFPLYSCLLEALSSAPSSKLANAFMTPPEGRRCGGGLRPAAHTGQVRSAGAHYYRNDMFRRSEISGVV